MKINMSNGKSYIANVIDFNDSNKVMYAYCNSVNKIIEINTSKGKVFININHIVSIEN